MTHEIPPETLNSNIEYCIDEYVRQIEHREMLREKWFHGMSFEEIAEKHDVTANTVKNVVYDIGDKILVRAATGKIHSRSLLVIIWSQMRLLVQYFAEQKQSKPYG